MPCLVKWDPSGINVNINPINVRVSTDTGTNFPDRNPPGFIPPDGDRVFLWEIEKHGGAGLAQRGYLYNFRKDEETQNGKAFLLQLRNADMRIQVLIKDHIKAGGDLGFLQSILKNAHSSVFKLTGEQAIIRR